MVNLKLAYEQLEKSTRKDMKDVKRVVDRLYKNNPKISYMTLISEASCILLEKKKVTPLAKAIKNMKGWQRKW